MNIYDKIIKCFDAGLTDFNFMTLQRLYRMALKYNKEGNYTKMRDNIDKFHMYAEQIIGRGTGSIKSKEFTDEQIQTVIKWNNELTKMYKLK